MYAQQLSENRSMLMSVRAALEKQIPCLAECGGFMYLHEKIRDREGKEWSMVGRIRGISYPTGKLVRFGYVNVIPMSETCKRSGCRREQACVDMNFITGTAQKMEKTVWL